MSYACENNIDLMERTFQLITEQLIILNNKIEMLEEKIDNININFKIINYTKECKKNILHEEIDWNSVHLY
jgi:hypothetical protein